MPLFKPPDKFDVKNGSEWPKWKQTFLRFYRASKLNEEDEQVQVDSLIYSMGPPAETVFTQLSLTEENRSKFQPVIDALDTYFKPRSK